MENRHENSGETAKLNMELSGGAKRLLLAACAGIGVYIVLRYLFPLVSPFLLSFCIVYLLDPWLERTRRRTHIRKEFLLVGILALAVTVILLLLWTVFQFGTLQAGNVAENWDGISAQVSGQIRIFFGDCCMFVEDHFGIDAGKVEQLVLERMDVLVEELRVEFVPKLMTESWWYAKKLLSAAAFLGVTFIASLLLCRDYDALMEKLGSGNGTAAPGPQTAFQLVERILHMAAVFLKTQGIIMLAVAGLCSLGLSVAKIKNALLLGILAGILDALPFIGTGVVLVPTAVWQLICGKYGAAVWCLVLYVICIGVRELLEPRLMGEKTGIYPVFMLLAVYAGVKLFGISGILKGPLALVILTEVWKLMKPAV